jgi:hypothetical protein
MSERHTNENATPSREDLSPVTARESLQQDVDDMFDDPNVRQRIGELIARAVLGPRGGN